jgi:hypothetical protein
MAFSRHPFSRRTRKLSSRARRHWLLVEHLEKRELLNASPLPAPPIGSLFPQQTSVIPLANPPTVPDGLQSPAGISWESPPDPIQKPPANSKAIAVNIPLIVGPDESSSPVGEGYTPAQLQQAYGFNKIALPAGETFNDAGRGQTIAIIDPLNDPFIVSDLQTFDETFNIGGAAHDPANTGFFNVVNEFGGSDLPPTDNGQVDFGLETSLDVEWAHAMAPGANILVVETSTPFSPNDLNTAIEFAARQPNVSVVSMSFGYGEWATEYYFDNIFTTPLGHQGVSFVSSAGDSGGLFVEYQATSPNVLSVGGTTLPGNASGNPNRALEYAWAFGGGGTSTAEAEPAYQMGVQASGFRTGPDLAYDADQTTGVAVYDTLFANAISPGEPWLKVGGTSMGAPQISSLVAIANQLRVAAGEGTLDGPNQLVPAVYQISATDPSAFEDITSGDNGNAAGTGYDLATGLGTPNAQFLVPDLVAAYSKPAAPTTLYWTGDVDSNWNTPGNWSTFDPLVTNKQQFILPTSNTNAVVDLSGATILHDAANFDTIRSLRVTAPGVTFDLGAGTIDLSGSGGRGTFQVDQAGDAVTMESGILANADVTSGTTLSAIGGMQYPELDDVQLDGTLNANQNAYGNGLCFTNGLIVNGTINLGSNSDQSSVLLAGYTDYNLSYYLAGYGKQDNNPETISGNGTIQLGQSQIADAIFNWGPGTFTIGPNITVLGGGPGSTALFEQTPFTGGLDNQGTIEQNGGTLVIAAFGPALYGWGPSTTTGWTNEGTIAATGGTLALLGGWTNFGTISAGAASTVLLGNPTYGQLPSDPDAAYYAWSSPGTVTIGNGATVYAGGFLTTDEYQGAAGIPGVSVDTSLDTLFLDGTLDNSPADNPDSGGVLALNAATGSLEMVGGTVIGGSISTSGSDDVQISSAAPLAANYVAAYSVSMTGGRLSNLTNDGTVEAPGTGLTLFNVTNNGTINGAAGATVSFLGNWNNSNGTVSIDSSSILDLGTPANGPPATWEENSADAWYASDVGTIDVANGAILELGGLMTADLFTAFQSLPGAHIDWPQDTVVLVGWMDDSPADNPVTGGALAFTSATGAVHLGGGIIYQGTITSSGTGALNVMDFGGSLYDGGGVLDGVTNDGMIAVRSNDFLYLEGAVTNNATLAGSEGMILFPPGGSFINNGSLNLTSDLTTALSFVCNSNIVNNGTIFLDAGTLEVLPSDPGSPDVTLTNTGTIEATDFSFVGLIGGLTNTGTISATNSRCFFEGNWDNTTGTMSADPASLLFVGYAAVLDPDYPAPPTIADFSPYPMNLGQVGTIDVADGGAFCLGGFITTDQFNAFPRCIGYGRG